MNLQRLLILVFIIGLSNCLQAQVIDTAYININDNNSIYAAVEKRVNAETDIINNAVGLDSIMKERVKSNIYTLNQMYFEKIRHTNFTMEKMLLREQVKYINGKREFLKLFLSEKDYKKYLSLEKVAIKADQKKYKQNPTDNSDILKLRSMAQGWDLLQQVIIFSE